MKKFIILTSLFLLAFSTSPQIVINSGYDYLPMKIDGTGIVYREATITGAWQSNMELWVMSRTNTGNSIRVTFTEYKTPAFTGIHQDWHYTHLPPNPTNYADGLAYTQSLAGGKPCMAEVRNEMNWYMSPGECILTYAPVAGETFTVTTNNYTTNNDNSIFQFLASGTWTYKTIATNITSWGPFCSVGNPCVRTALSESTGKRYNYVFAREQWVTETINGVVQTCWFPGGLVDIWLVDPNQGTPTTRPGFAYWARPCEI
jgi:hypothetical protein